jgi:cellulose synthase/poly-beta-1,6-N-acetylglucosamine synthase-like glycosyltransferase
MPDLPLVRLVDRHTSSDRASGADRGARSARGVRGVRGAAAARRRAERTERIETWNTAITESYVESAEITGPLTRPAADEVRVEYRRLATTRELIVFSLLVLFNAATTALFIGWLLLPDHIPLGTTLGLHGGLRLDLARLGYCVIVLTECVRLAQNFAVWVYGFVAKDPVPIEPEPGLRVAVLTTIVPSKEPLDIAERTLRAMKRLRYEGEVDVWILDEGDDPAVRAMAERIGVRHFSRKGRPEYNQPSGAYRAKTKSGNHNAWRAEYETGYDVVAQMDPDHVPGPGFLERTLGYFRDPDTAFVVAPQVYGNMYENWIAQGASAQQYLFSAVVERAGNGMGAPLLIGTNHVYRPTAWRQIDGYQDTLVEDQMTGMKIQGTRNPATGRNWRGVYTPDVLAVGEGPATWTDYFNQQKRWAYGIWTIMLSRKLRKGLQLSFSQRWLYGMVQFYYPSAALAAGLGIVATALYLVFGITSIQIDAKDWIALWLGSMASWLALWLWLRRFNLADHERVELGFAGMSLSLFAGPIYVAAGIAAVLRRPLVYAVTAKGSLSSVDSLKSFRVHYIWAGIGALMLAASFHLNRAVPLLQFWASLSIVTGVMPPLMLLWNRLKTARGARRTRAAVGGVHGAGVVHARPREAVAAEAFSTLVPFQSSSAAAQKAWAE